LGNFGRRLIQRIFALLLLGDIKKKARLFEARALLLPRFDNIVKGGLFSENTLGFFAIVPEIRFGGDIV
jgi:hypothetical protein